MAKVSFEKFRTEITDIDVPEEKLIKYFEADYPDPDVVDKDGFSPAVRIKDDEVELENVDDPRVEAAVLFGAANGLSRTRRLLGFQRAAKTQKDRPVIVTEGDSWFQFPFLLKDVVDNLSEHFSVYSLGAAGDTTLNMVFEAPEYQQALLKAEAIAGKEVNAFVFSSGGNDILGKSNGVRVLENIVRKHEPGETVSLDSAFNEGSLNKQFNFLRTGYEKVIRDIRTTHPDLPLFFHSYDNVWPYNPENENDKRKGIWVQPPLTAQGVTKFEDQRLITSHLIEKFSSLLKELTVKDPNVFFVDTGQPLADRLDLWHDEIHPNNEGYKLVSDKFVNEIKSRLAAAHG